MRHPAIIATAAIAAVNLTAFAAVQRMAQAAPADTCATAIESFPDASDVWGAISANPELSTFSDVVEAAGAADAFASDGPVTVLVPTNAAFDAIPPNVLDAIVADVDVLSTVLRYHVVPGASSTPDDLAAAGTAVTATGHELTFGHDGGDIVVNDQAVACGHASFDNGTVVVIDTVLATPSDGVMTGDSSVPASSLPSSVVPALTGEEGDVATAFETAVDSSLTYDDQAPFIEDAESIRATIESYPTAAEAVLGISASVTGVAIDGDVATITYTLSFNGVETPYGELDGTLIRVDGGWVVPLDEYCGFQAQARNACPA